MKKAFITGVTGQDGSYLAELLLSKGYEVHAILRRSSVFTTQRLLPSVWNHPKFITYHGDLSDSSNLHRLMVSIKPDEVYNLAAQSHVAVSFEVPEYTAEIDALGTLRLLDAIRDSGVKTKFYQASTSELFGGLIDTVPQNENTPFYPKSPYGVAKLYSYWICINYRESFGMFACNGILFNHESPRRGNTFVTKKITQGVANISKGKLEYLELGNLDAKRDWGHAKDYVKAMWMMLQRKKPKDFVIATGKTYSIRQFVEKAFNVIGKKIVWKGKGVDEIGIDSITKKTLIKVNEKYFRPSEVEYLHGDPTLAINELKWKTEYDLDLLVKEMVNYDLKYDDYGGDEENLY
tara:strand:+ start:1741 stop:2787 length:1047 start_codon:yes stop_codon:yes gene_type:complete